MLQNPDEAILEGILHGDEKVLKYVYNEYYQTIRNLITRNSGSELDVEDVFQDAMVIIYEKVKDKELVLECSFKTFLYSVCRNLWLQRLEKTRSSGRIVDDIENIVDLSDELMFEIYNEENEKYRLFQHHFLRLSKDCRKVLLLFLNKTPLKEIAEVMGYKTVKYAKTRKFLCKENLKKRILNDTKSKKFYIDE